MVAHDAATMTMERLAALAGVSVSSVSRALRGQRGVGPATAARIRALADEHHFQPNQSAVRLRRGVTEIIAIAVPSLNQWYFSELIAGAQRELTSRGYDTLIVAVSGPGALARIVDDADPRSGRVDGVVIVDLELPPDVRQRLTDSGIAAVTTTRGVEGCSSVGIDEEDMAERAVDHLIGLGHRRIGIIGGSRRNSYGFDVTDRRRAGALRALESAGIEHRPEYEAPGNFSLHGGAHAAALFLALAEPPTAIFAMSDEMAVGAWRSARLNRSAVPGDLSLIGIDGHPLAELTGLTTVVQPVAELGARTARLLLDQLAESSDPVTITMPTTLVARISTRFVGP